MQKHVQKQSQEHPQVPMSWEEWDERLLEALKQRGPSCAICRRVGHGMVGTGPLGLHLYCGEYYAELEAQGKAPPRYERGAVPTPEEESLLRMFARLPR